MKARIFLLSPKEEELLPGLLENGDEVEVVGFVSGVYGTEAVIMDPDDGYFSTVMVRLLRGVTEKVSA